MKKLLPLLISYVLMQGQCFALSGGPVYGGNGHVNTVGSYSGILQGVTEVDPSTSSATAIPGDTVPGGETSSTSSNALGLFDLVVPGTTTATGGFLLFADGEVFGGTITASVDPDSAKLSGIVDGTFSFSETIITSGTTTTTVSTVSAQAVGMITARIAASGNRSVTAARLTGSADLEVSFGEVDTSTNQPIIARDITFTVSGFQTTTSTATTSTIGTATSTGTSGATSG